MPLKKREIQVFFELLKDGRVPDKHIAQRIKTTQPTVTRIRQKLEREGYIKKYSILVDFKKVGITMIVVTMFKWADYSIEKEQEDARKEILKMPEMLSLSRGEGMRGKTNIIISAHEGFKSYEDFVRVLRKKWGNYVTDIESFISSVDGITKVFDPSECITDILSKQQDKDQQS
ncbi:MAG: Lrp/AsnC family transcriptional regulator [archaeon]